MQNVRQFLQIMNSIFVYALGFQRTSFRIIFLIQLLRKQLTILNYIPVVRVCGEFHQLDFFNFIFDQFYFDNYNRSY